MLGMGMVLDRCILCACMINCVSILLFFMIILNICIVFVGIGTCYVIILSHVASYYDCSMCISVCSLIDWVVDVLDVWLHFVFVYILCEMYICHGLNVCMLFISRVYCLQYYDELCMMNALYVMACCDLAFVCVACVCMRVYMW